MGGRGPQPEHTGLRGQRILATVPLQHQIPAAGGSCLGGTWQASATAAPASRRSLATRPRGPHCRRRTTSPPASPSPPATSATLLEPSPTASATLLEASAPPPPHRPASHHPQPHLGVGRALDDQGGEAALSMWRPLPPQVEVEQHAALGVLGDVVYDLRQSMKGGTHHHMHCFSSQEADACRAGHSIVLPMHCCATAWVQCRPRALAALRGLPALHGKVCARPVLTTILRTQKGSDTGPGNAVQAGG